MSRIIRAAAFVGRRFFVLAWLLPHGGIMAQEALSSWEARYDLRLDMGMARRYEARLQGTPQGGLFSWGRLLETEAAQNDYEFNLTLGASDSLGSYTYTDLKAGTMRSRIPFQGGRSYQVCEPVPEIVWHLSDSLRTIGPFSCRRATGTFRGREYEVWYTPELPVHLGPWKLHGLPGLAVWIRDAEGAVEITLKSWNPGAAPPAKPREPEDCMTLEAYIALQAAWAQELMRRMQAKFPRGAQISIGKQDALERFE